MNFFLSFSSCFFYASLKCVVGIDSAVSPSLRLSVNKLISPECLSFLCSSTAELLCTWPPTTAAWRWSVTSAWPEPTQRPSPTWVTALLPAFFFFFLFFTHFTPRHHSFLSLGGRWWIEAQSFRVQWSPMKSGFFSYRFHILEFSCSQWSKTRFNSESLLRKVVLTIMGHSWCGIHV